MIHELGIQGQDTDHDTGARDTGTRYMHAERRSKEDRLRLDALSRTGLLGLKS